MKEDPNSVFSFRHLIAKRGDLLPHTKLVLLTLSLHMTERGDVAYPPMETLAQETGLSEKAVEKHLAFAESAGMLTRELLGHSARHWNGPAALAVAPVSEKAAPLPSPSDALFEEQFTGFWDAYPLRKGKEQAKKALRKALTKTDFETILEGAIAYDEECAAKGTEEKYIKFAQGWLNGERWKDYTGENAPRRGASVSSRLGVREHVPASVARRD